MLGAEPGERHWGDLLAKYAGGQKLDMKNYKDIEKLKNAKSNIWGCPEWSVEPALMLQSTAAME
jgi:hypothetical protein